MVCLRIKLNIFRGLIFTVYTPHHCKPDAVGDAEECGLRHRSPYEWLCDSSRRSYVTAGRFPVMNTGLN
jgi:hypothetical protein